MASSEISFKKSNVTYSEPSITRVLETNERVTGPAGLEMLLQSTLLKAEESQLNVLDNASGAGVIPSLIIQLQIAGLAKVEKVKIGAADKDPMYMSQLEKRKEANGEPWKSIKLKQFDMQKIPLPDDFFSHVFSNFGIFFCQDDNAALKETLRVLKPGGQAGFTSWLKIGWWPLVESAFAAYAPDAPGLPNPLSLFRAGWNDTSAIRNKLETVGYKDISVKEYEFSVDVEPEPFAEACAALVNIALAKLWSKENYEKFAGDKAKQIIEKYLRENYTDGKWNGKMLSIITLGKKE